MNNKTKKIVVGISGASGAPYALSLLAFLKEQPSCKVAVVASANGKRIFTEETGLVLESFGFDLFDPHDFNAPFVSGSAKYESMVILPCSMGTLARIAHGISDDVMTRAADVFLKEKRPLILVPRETPLSVIHLENMKNLLLAGATIIPAMPSFYSQPKTINDLVLTVIQRVIDHLGLDNPQAKRWMQK